MELVAAEHGSTSLTIGSGSMPDIFRIQRPRLVFVVGPLDDGAAIGENGEFIGRDGELQAGTDCKFTVPIAPDDGPSPQS